ncbi:MAG: beta-propeller repeat protein [Verrucomicrobia bacterium]|nr:beta-propeller repeat protein [Verrucomicrobiota bacterium]
MQRLRRICSTIVGLTLGLLPGFVCPAASPAKDAAHVILYVDNCVGNDISAIDTVTQKAIGSIYTCSSPHGVAASPDGTRLYVTSEAEDNVTAIDTGTSTLLWTAPVGIRPNELTVSADGRYLYVPIRGADYVEVIDTGTHRTIKRIQVGPTPHNCYRAKNGQWIYVTAQKPGTASIIDVASQSVIGVIKLGGESRPCAITNDDRFLYAQLTDLYGFVVAEIATRKVIARVELPKIDYKTKSILAYIDSHGIVLSPDNQRVWIANSFGNGVDVFSVPEHKLLRSIPVSGIAPDWLDITPDGKFLYVSNTASDDVAVIDTRLEREVTRIGVGKGPKRLAVVSVPRGMSGPGDAGWDRAAARQPDTDCHLKGGGFVSCATDSFQDLFASGELSAESMPALYRKLGIKGVELNARYVRAWDDDSLDGIIRALHKEKRVLMALAIDGNLVSDDPDANQQQIEKDKRLLRAARYLGAPLVCVSLGQTGRGAAADASDGVERAILALRAMLPLARELGLRVTIENGPGPAKTPADIIRIIQGTDPVHVGLCLNFRNWDNAEAGKAAIEQLAPFVFHAHINGAAFDRRGNESTIDYGQALPLLAHSAYGSGLSIEFENKENPAAGVVKMRDLLVRFWVGKGTGARPASTLAER